MLYLYAKSYLDGRCYRIWHTWILRDINSTVLCTSILKPHRRTVEPWNRSLKLCWCPLTIPAGITIHCNQGKSSNVIIEATLPTIFPTAHMRLCGLRWITGCVGVGGVVVVVVVVFTSWFFTGTGHRGAWDPPVPNGRIRWLYFKSGGSRQGKVWGVKCVKDDWPSKPQVYGLDIWRFP